MAKIPSTAGGNNVDVKVDREHKASFDGLIIHFWWNIWKERNWQTFQQVMKPPLDIAYLIKEDINLFQVARSAERTPHE